MTALVAVRIIAVFSTGVIAGILFGDRMGNTFARPELPPGSFIRFQQIQNVHFARMMPFPIVAAILASVTWLVLIRSRAGTPGFAFLALGTLALIAAVAITRVVNIPINDQLVNWSASAPPPDLLQTWARWERAHTVRTVLAVLGFAFELLALETSKGSGL
jgi:uncharacterized membrane protein